MADSDDSETNEDVDDLVPQIGPGTRGANNLKLQLKISVLKIVLLQILISDKIRYSQMLI